MTEHERTSRNNAKLLEVHPKLRPKVAAILRDLEGHKYRPRIQCAFRSVIEQRRAFNEGHSQLRWGFHCAMSAGGGPQALAVDILDDNAPLKPSARFIDCLRRSAESHGMDAPFDWDPCHVEVTGITIAQARKGVRPQ